MGSDSVNIDFLMKILHYLPGRKGRMMPNSSTTHSGELGENEPRHEKTCFLRKQRRRSAER